MVDDLKETKGRTCPSDKRDDFLIREGQINHWYLQI
jgi:hypothetical protein